MSGDLKKPELLAPAGNLECAVAAFESGADAVYAGLSRFNAREKSDNFSLLDMSKLSAYAKKHKKKVYLTLNTLIKERELEEVFNTLVHIMPLNIDAVITQDIGIVRIIREFFPGLPIHASTQMGIHNSAGIRTAEKMGISRVIMERQVTLNELERILASSPLEIEVFVHGALCCSLSGNCLFSSWIGGWSGNRGKCKQPCRRRYYSKTGENGFFFSTNDLFTLDLLPRLAAMGISSLKIEGRLKKADYVRRSVRAYRMMLDTEPDKIRETLGKAKNILAGSPGRKWSSGFYTKESMETVVQYTSAGVSGLLSGEVVSIDKNGFTVSVSRGLKIGDRIRLQARSADEGPQFYITAMEKNGRKVKRAEKGEKVTILNGRDIPRQARVYKVGETPRAASIDPEMLDPLPPVTLCNLLITLSSTGITVSCSNFPDSPLWEKDIIIEKAEKKGITAETIEGAFRATRSSRLTTGLIKVSIRGLLFLPGKTLKELRREFWTWVEKRQRTIFLPEKSSTKRETFIQEHFAMREAAEKENPVQTNTYMVSPKKKDLSLKNTKDILSMSVFSYDKTCKEVFLPVFTEETSLSELKEAVRKAYNAGIRRFRIRSLFHIEILKEFPDIIMTAAYPLPVCNSFAAAEMKMFGIDTIQAWVELEKEALYDLIDYSPLPVEVYRKGRPHILVTRAAIHGEGEITDSHGVEFIVKKNHNKKLTFLYGKKPLELPEIARAGNCFDLTVSDLSETDTTTFNFLREWT